MTSELEIVSSPTGEAGCFPEPAIADQTIRRDEDMLAFLRRSTLDHAVELRRFTNANLRLLPPDVARAMCATLHGEHFRPSLFELVVARMLQVIGARELVYEAVAQTGSRPDIRATFDDGSLVVDATVPEFDAETIKANAAHQPQIDIIEDLIPAGWSFFVEELPRIEPNDSTREFKKAIEAERARLAQHPPPQETVSALWPDAQAIRVRQAQGEIRLRLGGRPSWWQRAYVGGPASAAFGDTDARVEKALRDKRPQLRRAQAPAVIAIAGGLGETIEDFDIALFGRTFERHDEHRPVVETGFRPSRIWGRLRGGEPSSRECSCSVIGSGPSAMTRSCI
jgi:hypothetical protein